jgi:AcrR family transcriptional regulator
MSVVPPSADEPRLRADAERNRQRILDAARAAFAERGLDVTLDQIAGRAGVGVGTVYRRFANKELLIEALFEDRMADLFALAEAALAHEDAWDGLVHFLERSLELQAADRGFKELVLGSTHGQAFIDARDRLAPPLQELFRRARDEGKLRGDAESTDLPMVGMMLGAVLDVTQDIEPALYRRYLAIVLDGLRARREAPSDLPEPALADVQVDEAMRCWRPPAR